MNQGKLVFSQLTALLPKTTFQRCVDRYAGNRKVKDFSCFDQFLVMMFAQLTYRESLRDIELNLRAHVSRLYHMGLRCNTVSRNTLSNAIATYVSIAIMKKRLNLKHSLYEILRVLDLNMFEMTPIEALLGKPVEPTELSDYPVQQDLFQTLGH